MLAEALDVEREVPLGDEGMAPKGRRLLFSRLDDISSKQLLVSVQKGTGMRIERDPGTLLSFHHSYRYATDSALLLLRLPRRFLTARMVWFDLREQDAKLILSGGAETTEVKQTNKKK